jgi:acylglycerol lipase
VTSATYVLDNQSELAGFICEDFAFQVPAHGFALTAITWLGHIAPHVAGLEA